MSRALLIFVLMVANAHAAAKWGCDLSFLAKLEHNGAVFSRDGVERDALSIFRAAGFGTLRLRLWHTPGELWHGLDSTVTLAQRGKQLGFEILLDIHYSDSWADPGQQTKPLAWQSLSFAQLEDSVYAYSNYVTRRFRDEDVLPQAVQIGNEIGGGMLWNDGRVGGAYDTPQQWQNFAALLNAGIAGVRDSLPESHWPAIVIHHQEGGNNGACRWFFDHLVELNVDFDVIGVSFYPWWHGDLDDLSQNLNDLASRYNKDVQVVETAYPWTTGWCDNTGNIVGDQTPLLPAYPATPFGQAFFLADLFERVEQVANSRGAAVMLWEPEWISSPTFGSPWENLALFDCNGASQPVFGIFPGLAPEELTIVRAGDFIHLRWREDANAFYRIYSGQTLLATTPESFYSIPLNTLSDSVYFFEVRAATTP
ncbi:glycosyl hydrolase 53 family protein [bacterium]|nr:glycosyl hydrolase 53 family protein [bacterium]